MRRFSVLSRYVTLPKAMEGLTLLAFQTNGQCNVYTADHGPLSRYAKLPVAHALEMPGTFSCHRLQRKLLVSDPGMQHGTCIKHMPWCMSGSLTRGGGETFPAFPVHAQPAILLILVRDLWVTNSFCSRHKWDTFEWRMDIFSCFLWNDKCRCLVKSK